MPAARKPGRKLARPKIEVRVEQAFLDRIAEAAAALGMTGGVSEYARERLGQALVADGFARPGEFAAS